LISLFLIASLQITECLNLHLWTVEGEHRLPVLMSVHIPRLSFYYHQTLKNNACLHFLPINCSSAEQFQFQEIITSTFQLSGVLVLSSPTLNFAQEINPLTIVAYWRNPPLDLDSTLPIFLCVLWWLYFILSLVTTFKMVAFHGSHFHFLNYFYF
jgi:hypothetical protein